MVPDRNITSLVEVVRSAWSRLRELKSQSLTTVQQQLAEDRLRKQLQDEGIKYDLYVRDDDASALLCHFGSVRVRDSGRVTDVRSKGAHPIHLALGEGVTVQFEPRDISHLDSWRWSDIDNAEFADVKRGTTYAFTGRVNHCRYLFNRGPGGEFDLSVSSDHKTPMTLGRLLRRLWNGS